MYLDESVEAQNLHTTYEALPEARALVLRGNIFPQDIAPLQNFESGRVKV